MMPVRQQALPNLKRKQKVLPLTERAQLERVLGFTVANNAALASDPNTGLVAYPAGCVIVLYNPRKNKQSHLVNASKKAITCLAFSRDGQYLATGECGHQPAVRVWDVEEQTQVAEFKGHKFGINVVAFSPNQRYLVSIGSQYDMNISVWNWKTQSKVASNKVATKVTDVAFTEDGGTLVTVGNRHVKFWNMDSSKSRIKETVPLKGHSGILGAQKNNYFCGVCCGCGEAGLSTYVITRSGLLCELNERRLMDKWVELRTSSANCLAAGKYHIFVGCANGIVRIFSTSSLHFLATMSTPHHLGVDVASGLDPSSVLPAPEDARYPDTVAIALDDEASRLSVIYNDHSLYIWDVHDIRRIGKVRSFLYHSGPIWGLKFYPILESGKQALPSGSFITCSSDDTIRVWNTEMHMNTDTAYKRNIYSNELIKVVYTDPDLTNILDVEFNPAGVTDKTDNQDRDSYGVRSLSVSHDGQHLASGDRVGNIRIHSLEFMDQLYMMEAHDSDVMCLNYTDPKSGLSVLASAGRDRLLHVFDCTKNYDLVQTLDDHSAAITAVQFIAKDGNMSMLSCGADKSILFRTAQKDPDLQFVLNRHLVAKSTFYDMCVDPKHKFMATACQDRNIRIYNTKNGKQKKVYSGSLGSDGTLIRLDLDRSGSYVASSCTDKNMAIYDFYTGECVASMAGHSEVVTGLQFSPDFKHLVTVSCDGCIFQWRLHYDLTEQMQARMNELEHSHARNGINIGSLGEDHFQPSKAVLNDLLSSPDKNANIPAGGSPSSGHPSPDYRFSVGHLPSWAKREISEPVSVPTGPNSTQPGGGPRGCWAQRADDQVVLKTVLDESALNGGQDHTRLTMGEKSILDQTDLRPMVQTIIADDDSNKDEDDDEDDEFRKTQPDDVLNQLESRMTFNGSFGTKVTYRRGDSNDLDDEALPEKDVVVFFPPKDDDQSSAGDTSSSYQVFEGDNRSVAESEGTEPHSLDSEDEETSRTSLPDTSGPASPDEEHFMRTNFPLDLEKEEFGSTFQEPPSVPADMTHRLSISTRFLTRSQQQQLRNATKTNLQRRQEEMTQAVMETRRRLQALGWKTGDAANRTASVDQAIPERDLTPTSPPSSPSKNADDRGGNKRQSINSRTQPATRDRNDAKGSTERGSQTLNRSRRDTSTPELASNRSTSMQNLAGGGSGAGGESRTGKPIQRSHSYRSATQSSKAKNRQSMGSARDLTAAGAITSTTQGTSVITATTTTTATATTTSSAAPRRSVGRKGRLNPALKNKFKSTPDLTIPENDVTPRLSPSKTTEDMGATLQRRGSADLYQSSGQTTHNKKDLFDLGDKERLGQRLSDPGTKTSTSTLPSGASSALMPPPLTASVPRVSPAARQSMPELTLEQAKEIVRNPTSVMTGGTRRAASVERSTAITRQRPRSVIGSSTESQPTPLLPKTDIVSSGNTTVVVTSSTLSPTNGKPTSPKPIVTSHKTVKGSAVDSESRGGREKMAASPMDLPEKDTGNVTFPVAEQISNHVNLVFTTPSRAEPLAVSDNSPVSSRSDNGATNDKRNVTFVVTKDGSTQPSSPTKSVANPCLINRLGRLGSSLSPIQSVGGEPDVDGQDDEHESLPFISDTANTSSELSIPAANQTSDPPRPQPTSETATAQSPTIGMATNVLTHLTRRRDPNARNCVSPVRQLNSTVTIPPPTIPAPQAPPRAVTPSLGSPSPTKDVPTGRISPTKSLSAVNRESAGMSARWQRAQQNRDQRHRSSFGSRSNSVQGSESESENSESTTVSSSSSPSSVRKQAGSEPKPLSLELTTTARDADFLVKDRIVKSPMRETSFVVMATENSRPKSEMTVEDQVANQSNGLSTGSSQQDTNSSSFTKPEDSSDSAGDSEEVKRPDKTRSSPPASLISAVTVNVQNSVVLTQPSPAIVTSPVSPTSPKFPVDPSAAMSQASLPPASPVCASRPCVAGDPMSPPVPEGARTSVASSLSSHNLSRSTGDITTNIAELTSFLDNCQMDQFRDSKTLESAKLRESLIALQASLTRVLGPSSPDFASLLTSSRMEEMPEAATDRVTSLLDLYSRELVSRVCKLTASGATGKPS